MKLPHRFPYTRYSLVAIVFFLGGCLFFDNSTVKTPVSCGVDVLLGDAHRLNCDYLCHENRDCLDEPGFLCNDEGICEEYCDIECDIEDIDCFRCEGETCRFNGDCESDFCDNGICSNPGPGCKIDVDCLEEEFCNGIQKCEDCNGVCPAECVGDDHCGQGQTCKGGICEEDCGQLRCDHEDCDLPAQCASEICKDGRCTPASCMDLVQNQDERGVDCGGVCPVFCELEACSNPEECPSGVCNKDGQCRPLVSSCEGIEKGNVVIGLVEEPENFFPAHCSGEWTLLGVSAADSPRWSKDGIFWKGGGFEEKPGPAEDDKGLRAPAYKDLEATEIKLCYQDETHCFIFELDETRSLASFFETGDSFISDGNERLYLEKLEFEAIIPNMMPEKEIKCYVLGINYKGTNGIGLVGGTSNCATDGLVGLDLALGVGLIPGTNSGYARYVTETGVTSLPPNIQDIGPWLIFGK